MTHQSHTRRPAIENAGRLFCALTWLALSQTCAAQSRPASQPKPFQPGVTIDWGSRAVYVDGRITVREGPLEYLACFSGKQHESIVLLTASAAHVYMALGLIGLNPGSPPIWDVSRQRYKPPTGDLVDISFEWIHNRKSQWVPAARWLREFESSASPIDRPWVFGGSYKLDKQTLAADRTGAGVALVDSPASLLSPSRSHADRDAELWVEANTSVIPPADTKVRLVLRPAKARLLNVKLISTGAILIDGNPVDREDLLDLVGICRRLTDGFVQSIDTSQAHKRKLQQLQDWIKQHDAAAWFRWQRQPSSRHATSRP